MKQHLRHSIAILAVLALLLAIGSSTVMAQGGTAMIRFVHVIPGASAVDIYTDGQLTARNLNFGVATTYASLPAGDHNITVTPADTTNVLWQQAISAGDGAALTLIAASANPPSFLVYNDDLNPLELGKARLTAIHAINGAPNVDLLLTDGRPVIPGLQYGVQAGTLDVPSYAYDFALTASGGSASTPLITANGLSLNGGTSYILLVYGAPDSPAIMTLSQPTRSNGSAGFLRVMHGIDGAPAVDVYVNGTLIAPNLGLGSYTAHIAIAPGTYDTSIRAAGSDQNLLNTSVTIEASKAATVVAIGAPTAPALTVFADNMDGMNPTQARASVINGLVNQAASVSLANGTVLVSDLASSTASASVDFAPVLGTIAVNGAPTAEQTLYGGVYYDLLAITIAGTPSLIVAPTSLVQGLTSAPGAVSAVVAVQPTIAPVVEPTAVPQPTVAPLESAPVQPTVAPNAPVASSAPVSSTGFTARVYNMNADRNLQLRQYASSDALSLATVPPNTILAVNGRQGQIEPNPNSATPNPPEDYEYVDPASLLTDPQQDLPPDQTWINVSYITPEGTTVSAWANALFLDVRNARGERVRLASLPTVAGNLPGGAEQTLAAVQPLPVDGVGAIVYDLNPGTNLNIRRIPDTSGEVLARVPNDTVMLLLGLNEARNWVYVQYSAPEGFVVTGWVNAAYIKFSYRDRPIKMDEIESRGLLNIEDDTTRGEVLSGSVSVAIPTVNPTKNAYVAQVNLNPGSNLNLRRYADATSEVLAQIPTGTQLIVSGRSADSQWLKVNFENIEGWIVAQNDQFIFVLLTFNGQNVTVSEVTPILSGGIGETEQTLPATTMTSTVPAPTSTPAATEQRLPVRVSDSIVQMTGSPGGNADGLPLISQGQEALLLFSDGTFSYIELPDFTRGWVPAGSVKPK
jgi:uncharacterized protein YgiM (DUF1202 family)